MNRRDQRKLLRTFAEQVTAALLKRSKDWPETWDGHDLRELFLMAVEYERTGLMRESHTRRRNVRNEVVVRNLY